MTDDWSSSTSSERFWLWHCPGVLLPRVGADELPHRHAEREQYGIAQRGQLEFHRHLMLTFVGVGGHVAPTALKECSKVGIRRLRLTLVG